MFACSQNPARLPASDGVGATPVASGGKNALTSPQGAALHSTCAAAQAAGARRFFTGQPCPKGHMSERYASNGICVACKAAHNAEAQADPITAVIRREAARKRAEREVAP